MHSLNRLELMGNKLTEIRPDMWEGLIQLWILELGDGELTHGKARVNNITYLPAGAFTPLSSLSFLSLINNQLEQISGDMWQGLSKLEGLSLSYNVIESIQGDSFRNLNS